MFIKITKNQVLNCDVAERFTFANVLMNEGEEAVTADGIVIPTGIGLTANVGTVYNLIWNEVDTGTTATWKEVDTAA